MFDKNDKIMVTGGSGFLGKHVVTELVKRGYDNITGLWGSGFGKIDQKHGGKTKYALNGLPRGADWLLCNLLNSGEVARLFYSVRPKGIIHLAAKVGGIGANAQNPASFMRDNLLMGMNVIHEAKSCPSMKKFVMVGTVCSYPKYAPVPFKEEDLWNGYPEETNAPYGIAKKTLMEMLIAYDRQYGMCGVNLIPVNLYGPGDNFHPENSHVIPALIRKVQEAIDNEDEPVSIWGDGRATREFLYVKDAATGIVDALEKQDNVSPVNMGTGEEISIYSLVEMIVTMMRYKGKIVYDHSKPNGQPRRCLNTDKALEQFGWKSSTPFDVGLQQTIHYWGEQCSQCSTR